MQTIDPGTKNDLSQYFLPFFQLRIHLLFTCILPELRGGEHVNQLLNETRQNNFSNKTSHVFGL